jgi:hypothetical protein
MTAAALMAECARRGIRLVADGGRLGFSPRQAMTPDLLTELRTRKGEVLAILTGSRGLEGFHGGDMQVGKERPTVGLGEGHEDAILAQRDGVGVPNVHGIAAGQLDPECLERIAAEEFSEFFGVHTPSIANEPAASKPPPDVAWITGDELTEPRDGWTPANWYRHLLQLADRCQGTRPDRAAELRRAAAAMVGNPPGARKRNETDLTFGQT